MFSSLDRVDLAYAGPDGRVHWLQSDHRPPSQIEAEAELSLVFALIRLLDPRRDFLKGEDHAAEPVLEYRCQHMPPELLRAAIASAGAILHVDAPVPFDGTVPDPESLARLALAALAARVARERDVSCDLAGLTHLERDLPAVDHDADEVAYWRAVVQLAAFTGEVLRTHVGGHWVLDLGDEAGMFPFVFAVHDTMVLDLFAAAVDRLSGDETVEAIGLSTLVETAIAARPRPDDPS